MKNPLIQLQMVLLRRMHWAILLAAFALVVIAVALIASPYLRPEQQDQMPALRRPIDVINEYLWNDTQEWLSKDPTHKVSAVIWLDQGYLGVHGINETEVAEWLITEHNATEVRIGRALGYIFADIAANKVFRISLAPVIEHMGSQDYPKFSIKDFEHWNDK